jgi:hypothetical protein
MLGDPQSFRGRGVIPRALAQVFAHIGSKPEADFAVSVSYLELYGDQLRDLLVLADATAGAAPGSFAAGLLAGRTGAGATAASAALLTSAAPLLPEASIGPGEGEIGSQQVRSGRSSSAHTRLCRGRAGGLVVGGDRSI